MPEEKSYINRYKCGKVAIVRNDKPITKEQRERCFGYKDGACSALEDLACKGERSCAFWKEKPSESNLVFS